MKKILFLTNLSDSSMVGLSKARVLFQTEEVTFQLLYIGNVDYGGLSEDNDEDSLWSLWNNEETDISLVVKELNFTCENSLHSFEGIYTVNSFKNAIISVCEKDHFDMIVMTNNKEKHFFKSFFQTKIDQTIEVAKGVPLLLISKDCKITSVKQMILLTNFKRKFKEEEVYMLHNVFNFKKIGLNVLVATKNDVLSGEQMKNKVSFVNMFSNKNISFYRLLIERGESRQIEDFINKEDSDISVFVHHKQHFFNHLFQEDLLENLLAFCDKPILVIPEYKK